jgi:hypothetical protein
MIERATSEGDLDLTPQCGSSAKYVAGILVFEELVPAPGLLESSSGSVQSYPRQSFLLEVQCGRLSLVVMKPLSAPVEVDGTLVIPTESTSLIGLTMLDQQMRLISVGYGALCRHSSAPVHCTPQALGLRVTSTDTSVVTAQLEYASGRDVASGLTGEDVVVVLRSSTVSGHAIIMLTAEPPDCEIPCVAVSTTLKIMVDTARAKLHAPQAQPAIWGYNITEHAISSSVKEVPLASTKLAGTDTSLPDIARTSRKNEQHEAESASLIIRGQALPWSVACLLAVVLAVMLVTGYKPSLSSGKTVLKHSRHNLKRVNRGTGKAQTEAATQTQAQYMHGAVIRVT